MKITPKVVKAVAEGKAVWRSKGKVKVGTLPKGLLQRQIEDAKKRNAPLPGECPEELEG